MSNVKPAAKGAAGAIKAVLWSFFGVRRGKDHDWDAENLKIGHVIAAGLIAATVFIFALVVVVKLVIPG